MTISTLLVAWVVIDSLFVATLKYLAFLYMNQCETALTARVSPPGEPAVARRVETYQGTTDRPTTGRAVKIKIVIVKERTHTMTEATLLQQVTTDLTATAEQQPVKNCIEVWYHEADLDILPTLERYLQLAYRRLGPQIEHFYLNYRKATPKAPTPYTGTNDHLIEEYEKQKTAYEQEEQKYQKRHDYAISLLKRTILFIPCVSNNFIEQFWTDMESKSELGMLMANPDFQIMPVVIRPTETGMMYQPQPLCTYEGHHLETACKEIASVVEEIIRESYGPDLEQKKTPVSLLFQSGCTVQTIIPSERHTADVLMERCLSTLTPIQALLEQTSARVVEAQRLALTSRSTSETELRKQLEQMKEQLTALQAEQNASLLTRIGRWLGAK